MKREIRHAAKTGIWSLTRKRRRKELKPIVLYATRRGGSTHLMQVIGANRGVRFSDQPFSVYTASYEQISGVAPLPIRYASQFVAVHPDEDAAVRAYVRAILEGRISCNHPWRVWRQQFELSWDRLLLKVLDAVPLIDWIDQNFDVDTLYYARHPVAVALSVLRREWDNTSRAYLQDHEFCSRYLTEDLVAYCWDVVVGEDRFAAAVVNWCLTNIAPLRLLPERPDWFACCYEDLVINPKELIARLSTALDLQDTERMDRAVVRASRSSRGLGTGNYSEQDRRRLVDKWQEAADDEMRKKAQEVLDHFGIGLYNAYDTMPHWESFGHGAMR